MRYDDFSLDMDDEEMIGRQFNYLWSNWRNRNIFISTMREAQNGLNKIQMPASMHYVVKVLHTYTLAALINEKTSRFLPRPNIQVVPDDDFDPEGRAKSSRIEKGINTIGYEVERRSGGDSWDRTVLDAVLLDMGVQKILRAPAACWPELVKNDLMVKEKSEAGENVASAYPLDSDIRKYYKKTHGTPITKEYVPLEYFYPKYDGNKLEIGFDVEERSLSSVLGNPLFKNPLGLQNLKSLPSPGPDGGISQTVNIVHYMNDEVHAYFIAGPGPNTSGRAWPKVSLNTVNYNGRLRLLYAYEHDISRTQYNTVGGRYGGWKTDKNRIEGVGKGILELSQAADEIVSQVLTNVRAKYWPNLQFKLDPDKRGWGAAGSKPSAPNIREGEPIVTFVGEDILPIFRPEDDPMVMWLWDKIMEQVSKLGGSAVLYGGRAPGVDTGYNQALQQTQAESLDNKLEMHIQSGAEEEALITCLHVKAVGEEVYAHYAEEDPEDKQKKVGKYVTLSPADLVPMPRFSAQVRKPRPVDYIAALRAAAEASNDREGKGPLLSDDTIMQDILNVISPDIEKKKILIESQERELIANGILSTKIGERINIKLAKTGTPAISPEQMAKADPALIAAITQSAPASEAVGGIDPETLAGAAEQNMGGGMGRQPGPAAGNPEPFNRLGEAVEGAMTVGGPV